MRILIAGCGSVGTVLAGLLAGRGHEVVALRRSPRDDWPAGVRGVAADLTRPGVLATVPAGIDGLVYTAGPASQDEAGYRRAYVEGLDRTLVALGERGDPLGRVLFTASTAVYHQDDGSVVDEESETRPTRFSGRVLLEAEARLAAWPGESCSLRLGGIYGPGRGRLVAQVREGRARIRPGPPHYTNRIHRDDAAGALAHLVEVPALPPRLLGVDDEPAEEAEVLRFLARELGVPEPPLAAPDEDLAPRRSGSKRCSNARLRATGYALRFPSFRSGYREMIRGSAAE